MNPTRRQIAFLLLPGAGVLPAADKTEWKAPPLRAPEAASRPIQAILAQFGKLVVAHQAQDLVYNLDIDLIINDAGTKELPQDSGPIVRKIISDLGGSFTSSRVQPPGLPYPVVPLRDYAKPAFDFSVKGSIVAMAELQVDGVERQGAGQGRRFDIGLNSDRKNTLTGITCVLTLDDPGGIAAAGRTAQYRILREKGEKNRNLSFYFAGNGFGLGSHGTSAQDPAEALYDCLAVSLMHVLGHALMIPFHTLSPVFPADNALETRAKAKFAILPQEELEQYVKRLFWAEGAGLKIHEPGLSPADRAFVGVEMYRRGLDWQTHAGWAAFAFQLWKGLNVDLASSRVEKYLAEVKLAQGEAAATAAKKKRAEVVGPATFGWPETERVTLLDLTRIPDLAARQRIVQAARQTSGCLEARNNPAWTAAGLRLAPRVHQSEIQATLRWAKLPLALAFLWTDASQHELVLVPLR